MLRIKKLDIFVVKSFLLLFAGTFFICLFIFMMQFLWRYVDEMVGKGLEIKVLAQFFFYSGLTLIPMSLPLAILLAALMTFGNFGERYELLSMKAAGIPLMRIIRPLVMLCTVIAVLSFFFQNVIGPKAQKQLWTLLVSMKQKSPELDIPENVFYSDIEGYNIYVRHKDKKTGLLRDVLIYNFSEGFESSRIIWAEEGKMNMTEDKQHLFLHLYNGEQFENLQDQEAIDKDNIPYRRESFAEKHVLIEFDTEFNMVDGGFLDRRSDIKNMQEISFAIDSLQFLADSTGHDLHRNLMQTTYQPPRLSHADSAKIAQEQVATVVNTDSVITTYASSERLRTVTQARSRVQQLAKEWAVKCFVTRDADKDIRVHRSDWHKKITLSLACIIFFFIGAPLGAIIRKGGLGTPVVLSVIIFILYYIIDSGATRIAKSGELNIVLGTWMSTLVLAPLGGFLTYKSNKDSVVFNIDVYVNFFRRLFGIRQSRHLFVKEVIIETPDYAADIEALQGIIETSRSYREENKLSRLPNYVKIFTSNKEDHVIADMSKTMEDVIEDLSNAYDNILLNYVNKLPVLFVNSHKSKFDNFWLNLLMGIVFPVGILAYLHIWRYRLQLDRDLTVIEENCRKIIERIRNEK